AVLSAARSAGEAATMATTVIARLHIAARTNAGLDPSARLPLRSVEIVSPILARLARDLRPRITAGAARSKAGDRAPPRRRDRRPPRSLDRSTPRRRKRQ